MHHKLMQLSDAEARKLRSSFRSTVNSLAADVERQAFPDRAILMPPSTELGFPMQSYQIHRYTVEGTSDDRGAAQALPLSVG